MKHHSHPARRSSAAARSGCGPDRRRRCPRGERLGRPRPGLGDQQVHAVATHQEVAGFFGGAREQYNQRGITDTRAEILDLRWPTDRMAIAVVRWPYLDAQGREKGTETSTYVLRRDERGALKLRVAVMHGAAAS